MTWTVVDKRPQTGAEQTDDMMNFSFEKVSKSWDLILQKNGLISGATCRVSR